MFGELRADQLARRATEKGPSSGIRIDDPAELAFSVCDPQDGSR